MTFRDDIAGVQDGIYLNFWGCSSRNGKIYQHVEKVTVTLKKKITKGLSIKQIFRCLSGESENLGFP